MYQPDIEESSDETVVRPAKRFSSEDIRLALLQARTTKPRSLEELKEGIRRYVRKRYGRD